MADTKKDSKSNQPSGATQPTHSAGMDELPSSGEVLPDDLPTSGGDPPDDLPSSEDSPPDDLPTSGEFPDDLPESGFND